MDAFDLISKRRHVRKSQRRSKTRILGNYKMVMNEQIKIAVDGSNRAQRNYDLSKKISDTDLQTLIYAAANSPSKQNETHYSLYVYTDKDIIKKIYEHTKKFTLIRDAEDREKTFKVENDVYIQDDTNSVTNSQIYANALFVYVSEEGQTRGGTHMKGKEHPNSNAALLYRDQLAYSIGISVGELIMAANLLGYKTGICSALETKSIKEIMGIDKKPKLLVGVGYPNSQLERTQHAETLNKDVPEKFRNGPAEDNWQFPSFNKYTKVIMNGN